MGRLLWFAYSFLCLFLFDLPICLLSVSLNSSSPTLLCQHDQSLALLQFKKSLSIESAPSTWDSPYPKPYPKTESWKEGKDCCSWDGVTCDIGTGNVIGLDLSRSLLNGTIYSNSSLFFLHHLQKLDLSRNDFHNSQISSPFGHFFGLTHLNLNWSSFSGQIPLEISHLSNLVSLDLSWNDLAIETVTFGRVLLNLTKLQVLDLSYVDLSLVASSSYMNLSSSLLSVKLSICRLQGKFPYLTHLTELLSLDLSWNYGLTLETMTFDKLAQNLTKLREVDLSEVNMSLVAPNSFRNLSSSLSFLKLRNSGLRGEIWLHIIPLSELLSLDLSWNFGLTLETSTFDMLVGNLTKLQKLGLNSINMSFVAPTSLMNLSSSFLSLSLAFCELGGKFPDNIFQLPNLQFLDLWGNEDLTGSLPRYNWSSSLHYLSLSGTKLLIDSEHDVFQNLKSLTTLQLRGCNFLGSDLSFLGNLLQLQNLDLSYNNFSGQIPSVIGNLKQLGDLDLSYNNFSGQIPSSFENLKQLYMLNLQNNHLNGQIPKYLGNFTYLSSVDFSNNLLNATIPSSIFMLPYLDYLALSNNLLTGNIGQFAGTSSFYYINLSNNKLNGSIPSSIFQLVELSVLILSSNKLTGQVSSEICKLNSLQILDLSSNNFSGFIPQCLGNLSNSILVLHLGNNNFRGNIPSSAFSEGNNLRYLNFNGNQLQGQIPQTITYCRNLEVLDLGNNEIEDTFPYFLGRILQLQILMLQSNKLHGSLTSSNANYSFPKVRIFDLSNNMFSGHLPSNFFVGFIAIMKFDERMRYMMSPNYTYDYSVKLTYKGLEIELVRIQTLLTTIDLSSNKFTGNIPQSIGMLKALKQLNLSHNHLTGNIQPCLGNLTNLESLDLSSNLLTGRIPNELADITFLQVFRVSYNHLEGPIPHGKQFNTFDKSSYEGNSNLCGFPLPKECDNGETRQVISSELGNESNSDENGFGWRAVVTGYGCGLALGVAIGYILFRTRKPAWFVRSVEVEGYLWQKRFEKNNRNSCRRRRN